MSGRASVSALLLLSCAHCTSEAYLGRVLLDDAAAGPDRAPRTSADASAPELHDAGASEAAPPAAVADAALPAPDASSAPPPAGGEAVCLQQGGFEQMPLGGLFAFAWVPMPWAGCVALIDGTYSAPEVVNETTLVDTGDGTGTHANVLPKANQGSTYVLLDTAYGPKGQTMSTPLCEPLRGGHSYSFAIDLASRVGQIDKNVQLAPGRLAVYAQNDACSLSDPPLWTSPPLTAAWTSHCVTFTAPSDATNLALRLLPDSARAAILIDNIRSEPGCGAP